MRNVIVGAGSVGLSIARILNSEGAEVVIIEQNHEIAREVLEKIDVMVVEGDATSQKVLKEAKVSGAFNFIAVTNSDEINIVSCMLAHKIGAKKKISRINNIEFIDKHSVLDLQDIGIDYALNAEKTIINQMQNIVEVPGAVDLINYEEDDIFLYSFRIEQKMSIANKKIEEIKKVTETDSFFIALIIREDKFIPPKGDEKIRPGDIVNIFVMQATKKLFINFISKELKPVKHIVICGADIIGIELAKQLQDHAQVILIESDISKAENAAALLSRTLVLQGPPAEPDMLEQANVANADIFLAFTEDEKTNFMAALLAKGQGVKRVGITTSTPEYNKIIRSVGIPIIINPKEIVIDKILQFVKRERLFSLANIEETDTQVMGFQINENSIFAQRRLNEIRIPEDAVVGAIFRKKQPISPTPDFVLLPGDKVIVLTRPANSSYLEKLFSKSTVGTLIIPNLTAVSCALSMSTFTTLTLS
jgi:trk system potassium uptake protein TrkA